jgi:hypothetical protein
MKSSAVWFIPLLAIARLSCSTTIVARPTCHENGENGTSNEQFGEKTQRKETKPLSYLDRKGDWDNTNMWELLHCDHVFASGPRPIPTQETWIMMRNAYRRIVEPGRSSILPTDEKNGFHVPYKVDNVNDKKGRGVFATAPIKKGTLVWSSHKRQSARFFDGDSYRQFVAAIPVDLACDIMRFSYVQDFGPPHSPELAICTDLDEGALINDQMYVWDMEANVGCMLRQSYKHPGGCKENFFALRDINAGEELVVNYSFFAMADGWEYFGL